MVCDIAEPLNFILRGHFESRKSAKGTKVSISTYTFCD